MDVFLCDPEKNTHCRKTACHSFCNWTTIEEFAKLDAEGKPIRIGTCGNCKHGHYRCEWDFQHNGNYAFPIECVLPENKASHYRRLNDLCESYEERSEKK